MSSRLIGFLEKAAAAFLLLLLSGFYRRFLRRLILEASLMICRWCIFTPCVTCVDLGILGNAAARASNCFPCMPQRIDMYVHGCERLSRRIKDINQKQTMAQISNETVPITQVQIYTAAQHGILCIYNIFNCNRFTRNLPLVAGSTAIRKMMVPLSFIPHPPSSSSFVFEVIYIRRWCSCCC